MQLVTAAGGLLSDQRSQGVGAPKAKALSQKGGPSFFQKCEGLDRGQHRSPREGGYRARKWALEFSGFRFFPSVDVHTLPLPSLFFSFLTSPQCFLRRSSGSRTAGRREASRESAALGLPLGQKTCSKTAAAMAIRATYSRINTPDNTRRGLRPLPGKTQCPVHVQPI